MFDDYKYKVEGFILLDILCYIILMFVDDILLFLKGDCENLNNIMKVLDINCKVLGVKINWNKILVI